METVGLVTIGSSSNYGRRIDNLHKKGIYYTYMWYILSLLFILSICFFGPPYMNSEVKQHPLSLVNSYNRLFRFEISGFNYFNRFLIYEMSFGKHYPNISNSSFEVSVQTHLYKDGKEVCDHHFPLRDYILNFAQNSDFSESIRLFSFPIVHFDTLKSTTTVKFVDGLPLPTKFAFFTVDSAYSVLSIVLRSIICFISVIVIIQFKGLNLSLSTSSISSQLTFALLIVMFLATNPFFILDYFSDSSFFTLAEAFLSQLFFIFSCYSAFLHLLVGDRKDESPPSYIYGTFALPFVVAFVLMFGHSLYSVSKLAVDPVVAVDTAWKGLALTKYILIACFIPIVIFVSCLKKNSAGIDQLIHSQMTIEFIFVIAFVEIAAPTESLIGTNFAMQVFTTASCSVYAFFFAYLNWPVELTGISDSSEEEIKDDILQPIADADNTSQNEPGINE